MFAAFSGAPHRCMMPRVAITPIANGNSATSMCRRLPKSKTSTSTIARKAYRPAHRKPLRIARSPSRQVNGLPVASESTMRTWLTKLASGS